ncbi:unnamed protein product [Gadus morhua 'NCC']
MQTHTHTHTHMHTKTNRDTHTYTRTHTTQTHIHAHRHTHTKQTFSRTNTHMYTTHWPSGGAMVSVGNVCAHTAAATQPLVLLAAAAADTKNRWALEADTWPIHTPPPPPPLSTGPP